MPWTETYVEDQRMKFVSEALKGEWFMNDLCVAFGVSRKTGYKWLARYEAEGLDGLKDRSRAPKSHPNATAPDIVELLLDARLKHRTWGPVKLLQWLERKHPRKSWPAPSTAGDILKRNGLVQPRKRRRRGDPRTQPFAKAREPNDVWCADHKGWFRTRDGERCEPLTISDATSRFLLTCKALTGTSTELARPAFEKAFREYGLPIVIHTDNGSPFGSRGLGGLTKLSAWWIKLGIRPERIDPGQPQQNGRHERIHLTLSQDVSPRAHQAAQQRAFNAFKLEYNYDRPHEALGGRCPGDLYTPSPRPYPNSLPQVDYPAHFEVRSVKRSGEIRWGGGFIHITQALHGEWVGLEQKTDRHWTIFFGGVELGILDDAKKRVLRFRELNTGGLDQEKPQ